MTSQTPLKKGRFHLILNLVGIVVAIKMIVFSIFVFTWDTKAPPMHIAPDMDFQPKVKAQQASTFFADGRSMRTPPTGTVARGTFHEDLAFYEGVEGDADPLLLASQPMAEGWVNKIPAKVDQVFIDRGQKRYDIFCSPCHGLVGDGISEVARFMNPKPKNLHADTVSNPWREYRAMPDGYLFHVISRGFSTMEGYAEQLSPEDRWAIVAYLRALQANATLVKER